MNGPSGVVLSLVVAGCILLVSVTAVDTDNTADTGERRLLEELKRLVSDKRSSIKDASPETDISQKDADKDVDARDVFPASNNLLQPAMMRVEENGVENHLEARGFAWLHVSPEQTGLVRSARDLIWKGAYGNSLPCGQKIKGGYDSKWHQYYQLCQAYYNKGNHPGKYFSGSNGYVCNIGYGSREISMKRFKVLVNTCPDKTSAVWVPYPSGSYLKSLPIGAVQGGSEPSWGSSATRKLYICRAWYSNAYNPGKILVDSRNRAPYKCNFGWGGREKVVTKFQVLVDTCYGKNNGRK